MKIDKSKFNFKELLYSLVLSLPISFIVVVFCISYNQEIPLSIASLGFIIFSIFFTVIISAIRQNTSKFILKIIGTVFVSFFIILFFIKLFVNAHVCDQYGGIFQNQRFANKHYTHDIWGEQLFYSWQYWYWPNPVCFISPEKVEYIIKHRTPLLEKTPFVIDNGNY